MSSPPNMSPSPQSGTDEPTTAKPGTAMGGTTFENYAVPAFPQRVLHRDGRRYFLRIAILALAALIIAGGIISGIALILQPRHVLIGEFVIAGSIIIAIIVASVGMYYTTRKDEEQSQRKAQPSARSGRTVNQQLLAQYHDITRQQATSSYRISQIAMAVGFLMIVGGAYVVITQAKSSSSQIVVGGLAGLGALFSSYIGATFIRTYNRALAQMNFYYAQPLVQSYILEAERISKELGSPTSKDSVLSQIIEQTLRGADYAAQLTRPSDDNIRSDIRTNPFRRNVRSGNHQDDKVPGTSTQA
jgi:hypothetical protein